MPEHNRRLRCEKCNRPLLNDDEIVWLEFDQRINKYTSAHVPEQYSQGGFPFGNDCAKKVDHATNTNR